MRSYVTKEYPISLTYEQKVMLEVMLYCKLGEVDDENKRTSIKDLLSKLGHSFVENC